MKSYKKPTPEELKKKLTAEQYAVTQEAATEPPFRNQFWNEKRRHLRRHRVGRAALQLAGESSTPAAAGRASRSRSSPPSRRPTARTHGAQGGALHAGRLAPRPLVRRRTGADAQTLLHQLGGAALCAVDKMQAEGYGDQLAPSSPPG